MNPGNFGIIDTTRRLQVERWIRSGEPPVLPGQTDFGITGRNGVRHAWYGIGQSLVLLPLDALVRPAAGLVLVSDAVKREQFAELIIAFLMQALITYCVLALAYRILLSFQFEPRISRAGVLVLLFATTYLQYVQCAAENDLLFLCSLGALYSIRRWQNQGGVRWPLLAGAACGFAIVTRLPSVLEAAVLFAFAVLIRRQPRTFLAGYLPPIALALLFDRWYQWLRFGEWFSTYTGIVGRQSRPAGAPASFPFSYPFWKGFWGALVSPDKSIFLFDPLLIVMFVVTVWRWRDISNAVRLAIGCFTGLLLLYNGFYATYYDFGGDVAWGHRFLTLPVHLLCLFAAPLLLTAGAQLPKSMRIGGWMAVIVSVVLQVVSTTLPANLEIIQREHGDRAGVIVNRFINLTQVILNREDSRRFLGVPPEWRSLYYFPFQLHFRLPQLAGGAIAIWGCLSIALVVVIVACAKSVIRNAAPPPGRP